MIDYSSGSGLLYPKAQPRVLSRIDKKLAIEAQARACRKAIKKRDKGHCRVPNCRQASAHAHHIVYRSHGGRYETGNIVSLCVTCHAFVHSGVLRISGNADETLTFTYAWQRR